MLWKKSMPVIEALSCSCGHLAMLLSLVFLFFWNGKLAFVLFQSMGIGLSSWGKWSKSNNYFYFIFIFYAKKKSNQFDYTCMYIGSMYKEDTLWSKMGSYPLNFFYDHKRVCFNGTHHDISRVWMRGHLYGWSLQFWMPKCI